MVNGGRGACMLATAKVGGERELVKAKVGGHIFIYGFSDLHTPLGMFLAPYHNQNILPLNNTVRNNSD